MIALLAKLVPFRDWLYAVIAVAAVIFWFHHDHVEQMKGEAAVKVAVATATAKAEKAAQARVDELDLEYADAMAKVQANYETQLAAAADQHTADLQRLRNSAAGHGRPAPAVESTGAAPAGSASSAPSAQGLGIVPAELGLELADALRHDYAELQQCWAERDSLTGK